MLTAREIQLIESGLVGQKTNAVYDAKFNKIFKSIPWQQWFAEHNDPLDCKSEYLDTYKQYLSAMKSNHISGLDRFSQFHLINGTTQTFDEAYYKYSNRRLMMYRGEYAYHRRIVHDWAFIEDTPIQPNDYVIVSVPHCTTGDVPVDFYEMLDTCARLKVPVIVDCAYIGTCCDVAVDLEHPAIESVSFSLTKGTGTGHIRSGIRFSNIIDDMPICQQNRYNHTILGAAKVGIYFMKELQSPDYIPNIYRTHQLSICEEFGITPTKCMHIALGDADWEEFIVDGYYRIGIRNLVKARKQGTI
jgi:hypothetical protein